MRRHITLVEIPAPKGRDINYELQWLGNSLGLFGERDKDKSCFRVFITLVKEARRRPLSSDQIAEQLTLSRGTVVHHIHHLVDSGMVEQVRGGYSLRMENLQMLIEEMHRDAEHMFQRMKKISEEIDKMLGL
ncbi:MAG TPA: helix-turn-helix domain-containing protein [Candidatus Nanoarchaeia archaeon]|nr:helix-turn-helix domain-containing protein [Candidatus Nanoarchaeia archaeon]